MKRLTPLTLTVIAASALFLLWNGAGRGQHTQAATPPGTLISPASELPENAKPLTMDTPLLENLEPGTSLKFYTFSGQADQMLQVAVEPKTGDFFLTITILSSDFQTVIGGTTGEYVTSGLLVVRLPTTDDYAISVEYGGIGNATPAPGSYQITLSNFKAK